MPAPVQQQSDPLTLYERRVASHALNADEAQLQVMRQLQALYRRLFERKYASVWVRILSAPPAAAGPESLYIWGDVGRGKSLLMDMFYESVTHIRKKRLHFHALMQEVHARIHAWRMAVNAGKIMAGDLKKGPLVHVAQELALHYGRLICIDELQVTDVADAMILGKLFAAMLDHGISFVITSNRPPEELYKGGLQREKFLEFVRLLQSRMDVVELKSPHDYRMAQIRSLHKVYLCPQGEASQKAFEQAYAALTRHAAYANVTLEIQGRKVIAENACGGIARFTFSALCEKPLGSADYLLIASRFHTVFISDIPQMGAEKRNEARRLITLIDALYDHKVKLICTASVTPERLYTGHDGAFEFQRAASRLIEMQSEQYLALPHMP